LTDLPRYQKLKSITCDNNPMDIDNFTYDLTYEIFDDYLEDIDDE
jgi:hypothetical protein